LDQGYELELKLDHYHRGAMLYAKALAVGVATGVIAPVVAGAASFGCAWASGWPFSDLVALQFWGYFVSHSPAADGVLERCRFPVVPQLAFK
jgi:hypothetical protein